jgi:hypothetical protein
MFIFVMATAEVSCNNVITKPIKKGRKSTKSVTNEETNNITNQEEPSKTKRGRKPKVVYNSVDIVSNVHNASDVEDENVIVKLNIKDETLVEMKYEDDEIPYAYNHDYYNKISMYDEIPFKKVSHIQDDQKGTLKVVDLLKDFEEKNKNNEWPSNTTIHCYWDCCKFDNPPFGIPINFDNDNFDVYGCFCSLECATAYNFKMNHNIDEMWERYNLINLLSRRIGYKVQVKPAPDRLSLKHFGGFMDIDQFRMYTNTNRFVNVNFPPMTSITQQLEEINEYDLKNDMKYIPIDNERIKKYKEKVFFRRNKPLIDQKNSIESTMILNYDN